MKSEYQYDDRGCIKCKKPIELARLETLPLTNTCAACAGATVARQIVSRSLRSVPKNEVIVEKALERSIPHLTSSGEREHFDIKTDDEDTRGNVLNSGCASVIDQTTEVSYFEVAKLVIEYNPEAEQAWLKISELPDLYKEEFLSELNANPEADPGSLFETISKKHLKIVRPYSDERANDILEEVRTISDQAELEFKKIYKLIGKNTDVDIIYEKIEKKFGPSEQTASRERKRLQLEEQNEKNRRENEAEKQKKQNKEIQKEQKIRFAKLKMRAIFVMMSFFLGLIFNPVIAFISLVIALVVSVHTY